MGRRSRASPLQAALFAIFAASAARAQEVSLSDCSSNCYDQALDIVGCSSSDIRCVCSYNFEAVLNQCQDTACSSTESLNGLSYLQEKCSPFLATVSAASPSQTVQSSSYSRHGSMSKVGGIVGGVAGFVCIALGVVIWRLCRRRRSRRRPVDLISETRPSDEADDRARMVHKDDGRTDPEAGGISPYELEPVTPNFDSTITLNEKRPMTLALPALHLPTLDGNEPISAPVSGDSTPVIPSLGLAPVSDPAPTLLPRATVREILDRKRAIPQRSTSSDSPTSAHPASSPSTTTPASLPSPSPALLLQIPVPNATGGDLQQRLSPHQLSLLEHLVTQNLPSAQISAVIESMLASAGSGAGASSPTKATNDPPPQYERRS